MYEDLGWSNDSEWISEVLGYKIAGKWGLMTVKHKRLAEPQYYSIQPLSQGFFRVAYSQSLDNRLRHGLLNAKGKVVLSCNFFSIEPLGDHFLVSDYDNGSVRYGIMDGDFEEIIPQVFVEIKKLNNVFALLDDRGQWTFRGIKGNQLIPGKFNGFQVIGDYLEISKKGMKGLIDSEEGIVTHGPHYKALDFEESGIEASTPPTWELYSRDLKKVRDVTADSIFGRGKLVRAWLNEEERLYLDSAEVLAEVFFELKQLVGNVLIAVDKATGNWIAVNSLGTLVETADSIFYDGTYLLVNDDAQWDIYNRFGRKVNKVAYDEVGTSQEYYLPVKKGGEWGLMDFQGDLVLKHAYDSIGRGLNLTFPAKYVGSWGILNAFGHWLVQPGYESMSTLARFYVAERRGLKNIFTAEGSNLYTTRARLVQGNESIEILSNGKYGLISDQGVVIFDPIYDQVSHKGDFYLGGSSRGGVIKDSNGEFLLRLDEGVSEVFDLREGFFHIVKNGLHGFVDEQGRLRIANRYDSARAFHEERAAIMIRGSWGFIDKEEELVIQPYFKEVSDFKDGLAIVTSDLKGLIDLNGQMVINMEVADIERTLLGSYILTYPNGKKGLADEAGNIVLSPLFDEMQDAGDGLIIVGKAGKKGIYNVSGKLLVSFEYDEIVLAGDYLALLKL